MKHRVVDGEIELLSPGVGYWREPPGVGHVLTPGESMGRLETLGAFTSLVVPKGAAGLVVSVAGPEQARFAVGYGEVLVVLDPEGAAGVAIEEEASVTAASGLVFAAPMAGRFYARPSPEDPPFVAPGDTVKTGDTIGLLEVMKTFNRVTYGGDELPESATIERVVPADGDDVGRGDPILVLAE